jgi:hypothetical protein
MMTVRVAHGQPVRATADDAIDGENLQGDPVPATRVLVLPLTCPEARLRFAHPEGVASTTSNTRLLPIAEWFPTVADTLTVGENQYACPPGRPMRRNAAVELVRTVDAAIALCGGVTDILLPNSESRRTDIPTTNRSSEDVR